jgi:Cystatin domain
VFSGSFCFIWIYLDLFGLFFFCFFPLPLQNSLLEFVRVVMVKQRIVAGIMYVLTIVKDGAAVNWYEAKILVKPWLNF